MSTSTDISDKKTHIPIFVVNRSCILKFLLFFTVTLLIHLIMLNEMFKLETTTSTITGGWLIIMHVVFVTVLVTIAYYSKWSSCGRALFLLLAGTTAMLGLVGIIGTFFVFILFLSYGKDSRPFDDWYAELFPDESRQYSEELADKLRISTADTPGGLSPFKDILAFGNQSQKLSMIALITGHFKPAFASILQEAVNSPDNAIRVQAATAISHVENEYTKKSLVYEKQILEDPHNPELLITTAKHIDEYAFSGLLDDLSATTNRNKAIGYYKRYLELDKEDLQTISSIGRLLLKNGQIAEAEELLKKSITFDKDDLKIVTWYMDALYQNGKYDLLNEIAEKYVDRFIKNTDFPIKVIQSIQMWANSLK
ncbi:MAG: hypothetical protein HQL69_03305 [Magnetococcales bacterium]|nr:hypothetical protein [Magnetococcales bacterium]